MIYYKVKSINLWINTQMQDVVPKHIEKALFQRQDELMLLLDEEGFKLWEIKFMLNLPLTTQGIHQKIINLRSKKGQ